MKFHLNQNRTMIFVHDQRYGLKAEFDLGQVQELLAILPAYEKRMVI